MRLFSSKYFGFILQTSCIAFSLAFSSTYACTQTPGDNSCNTKSKPASTKQSSKVSEDIGNPISLISGNKFQKEIDYEASGGIASLVQDGHYVIFMKILPSFLIKHFSLNKILMVIDVST